MINSPTSRMLVIRIILFILPPFYRTYHRPLEFFCQWKMTAKKIRGHPVFKGQAARLPFEKEDGKIGGWRTD
jgi:hypothetical protein